MDPVLKSDGILSEGVLRTKRLLLVSLAGRFGSYGCDVFRNLVFGFWDLTEMILSMNELLLHSLRIKV